MNEQSKEGNVPCGICGTPTPMTATKRCDRCWELERGIHCRPDLAAAILAELRGGKSLQRFAPLETHDGVQMEEDPVGHWVRYEDAIRFSDGNSADAKDAARWRRFCGLMAYGDFIVQDSSATDESPAVVIDFIAELEQAVDGGSDTAAKIGREDDTRAWRDHNTELPAP